MPELVLSLSTEQYDLLTYAAVKNGFESVEDWLKSDVVAESALSETTSDLMRPSAIVVNLPSILRTDAEAKNEWEQSHAGLPFGAHNLLRREIEKKLQNNLGAQLVVMVESSGGSVEEAIKIYSLLKVYAGEVLTVGLGYVDSAALFPFLAGDERICLSSTTFLCHPFMYSVSGTTIHGLQQQVREVQKKMVTQLEIVTSETKIPKKVVRRWFTRETKRLSANEAHELGIVHRIVNSAELKRAQRVIEESTFTLL